MSISMTKPSKSGPVDIASVHTPGLGVIQAAFPAAKALSVSSTGVIVAGDTEA